jgi:phage gpG-like protein
VLEDLLVASQMAAAIDGGLRFDKFIESFEFKPSIGIVAKRLGAFAEELSDQHEPLQLSVSKVMTLSILENFMSGGRPKWEDLAPATIVQRKDQASGDMPLVRSGALAEVASSEDIWSIGRSTATVRALPEKVWYGNIHQGGYAGGSASAGNWFKKYRSAARKALGPDEDNKEVDRLATKMFDQRLTKHGAAPRAASSIPARPFILFQEEDIDAIELIFIAWVEAKMAEAGF